ncbi:hypothetical protein [Anaerosinus massiliensis]|uniref:hypothetical protein n=1 Tax=Massilibacillus massiliensis TaxID=1806837 RepID=UPI0018FEAC64|nr:hypothetical protein [Massilibacillus massiliensis]
MRKKITRIVFAMIMGSIIAGSAATPLMTTAFAAEGQQEQSTDQAQSSTNDHAAHHQIQ